MEETARIYLNARAERILTEMREDTSIEHVAMMCRDYNEASKFLRNHLALKHDNLYSHDHAMMGGATGK